MKKLIILATIFVAFLSSCSKSNYQTITQDVNIELLANETYEYALPMENTDDNYFISTASTIAARNEVISNVFYYTAPATFATGATDLVVTTNEHNAGRSGSGGDQHYIVNFHIKFVTEKTQ